MIAARKLEGRAAPARADAAGHVVGEPQDRAMPAGKASSYVEFKLAWLEQIATDGDLPPLACSVAVLLATRYLNRATRDAWPAIETIASDIGRSVNSARAALHKMAERGHVKIEVTVGGKGQKNRYRPLLKPSKKREGLELGGDMANPPENASETLQKTHAKPSKKREGNPLEEPLGGTQGGPSARPVVPPSTSSPTIKVPYQHSTVDVDGGRSPDGAPAQRRVFEEFEVLFLRQHGTCRFMRHAAGNKIMVRVARGDVGHDVFVPLDSDGNPQGEYDPNGIPF